MTALRLLRSLASGLALAAAVAVAAPADAGGRDRDGDRSKDKDREQVERALSLDEAIARAEKRHRARAVHGEERRRGDRIVYRIRLLDAEGKVFEVTVDASTGSET